MLKKTKKKFHHLFVPHHRNNFRSKLLHHDSLQKIIILLLIVQVGLSIVTKIKPGVLGYASNITAADIITMTNQKRAENGLGPLSNNSDLATSAAAKARHMFSQNYWAHNAPDGTTPWYFFRSVDYTYLYAGENLARDFGDSASVIQAWMDSPTHRENMLSGRYDEIGVGVVNGTLNGQETTLVVQHFGKQAVPQVAADTDTNTTSQEEARTPEIALQEKADEIVETVTEEELEQPQMQEESSYMISTPSLSTFQVTKTLNIVILAILIIALFIDGLIIYKNKMARRTGKNLVHIIFFIVISIILALSQSGNIL